MKPRDALFGGRTNAFKLYHKCKANENIKYIDYTSLYPYVQKYGVYPIGHPEIILENIDYKNKKYFGLVKCKLLPPQNLHLPVLLTRIENHLLFPLCRTCCIDQAESCNHNDDERVISGTWCTLEVDKALEYGYKITDVDEVWHWSQSEQYDKDTKSGL